MQLNNVTRLLLFAEAAGGQVLTLEQLAAKYGLEPAGTNFYYGINQANVDDSGGTSSALNPTHRAFFDAFLTSLKASSDPEKTVMRLESVVLLAQFSGCPPPRRALRVPLRHAHLSRLGVGLTSTR